MIPSTRKLLLWATIGFATILGLSEHLVAQGVIVSDSGSGAGDIVPSSYQGSGSFFNRQLGTVLRASYQTRGYGVEDDIVTLGSMKVINLEGSTIFFDGQATLSNDFGGGFNMGVGYRELVNTGFSFDPQRIHGVSFWTDGQSSRNDNFFTQLGFSLESLGESIDLRLNGHFPLNRTQRSDPVLVSLDELNFRENELFSGVEQFAIDTALSVVDGEVAKRIMNLEAWGFLGGYQIGGGGVDATGFRLGVRGYAMPDLALSLQVTDDEIYNTNVMFGITWFVGRTGRCNQPTGTIVDRFREPVQRNNFIAMTDESVRQVAGDPLRDRTTLDQLRITHVGTATSGNGDGTFENPYNNLTNASAALENDIVFVHSGTTLTDSFVAKDGQRILGEGLNGALVDPQPVAHIVDTFERGLITLPERFMDSSMGAAPTISGAGLTAFTLADDNTVNNFVINGVGTAVLADTVNAPTLQNLRITTTTGDAIVLRDVTGSTVVENTVRITGAAGAAVLIDGGLDGMSLAAEIANTAGSALTVQNRTGGTITYSGIIGDVSGEGISLINNTDATVLLTNASTDLTNGIDLMATGASDAITITGNMNSIFEFTGTVGVAATGANNGIVIANNDMDTGILFSDLDATAVDGDTVSIDGAGAGTTSVGAGIIFNSADDTRTIENTGTGTAVAIVGDTAVDDNNATVTVTSNVLNTNGGLAVDVQDRGANNVSFSGTVDSNTNGGGIFAQNNEGGSLIFSGLVTLETGTSNGVTLTNNTDAAIGFDGLEITTTSGIGFTATGGGNLVVSSPSGMNSISTTTGVALNLNGVTVDGPGVNFDTIDVVGGAGAGISLTDVDGAGQVNLGMGTDPGDGGTLVTAGTAIEVSNVVNLAVNNITINNVGAAQGVSVTMQEAGSTAVFTGLNVTTVNGDAVNVSGNLDGAITFNDLTATTSGTGDAVELVNNMDATVTINGMEAMATGSGNAFSATGGGNLAVTGTNNLTSDTGIALEIDDQIIAAGGAGFTTVNAGNAATQAIALRDITGGALTIGSGTDPGDGGTLTSNGTAIVVDNSTNVTFTNVTVDNDSGVGRGAGIDVLNNDSGAITFNGVEVNTFDDDAVTVRDNAGATVTFNDLVANTAEGVNAGDAIVVQNNTSGQFRFNNSDVDTTAGRGVFVDNNGTATTTFAGLNLNTTTGDGFTAMGSGTLAASGTNNITTTTGVGLTLDGTTIAGGGASFTSVSVDGATNGVVLNDLAGGQVTVGSTGTASTLENTTGDAIQVTNAANVDIVNVDVTAAGGNGLTITNDNANAMNLSVNDLTVDAASGAGIVATHTGGGDFTLLVDNSDIDSTVNIDADGAGAVDITFEDSFVDTTGNDVAFTLALGTSVDDADVRIRRNEITADDATAFDMDIISVASKTVNFLFDANTVANNSLSTTAEIDASQATILNATITDSFFSNANAGGDDFDIAANSATTVINMQLNNNTAGGGAGNFTLRELNASNFSIQERDTVEARNSGGFTFDSLPAGDVTDFDDLISVPLP